MSNVLPLFDAPAEPPSPVRDADLLARIEAAPHFVRQNVINICTDEQAKRDRLAAMSPTARRRELTRKSFEEQGVNRQDLGHIHSVLAIASLPYVAQPLSVRSWEKTQGRMSLKIQAGQLMSPEDGSWIDQPIPYGSKARLINFHLCSQAIRQKSRTIEIADTLTGFIRSMGYEVTGGKNGNLNAFKTQVNALAACTMRIGVWNGHSSKTINTQAFSELNVWLPSNTKNKMLWPSTITFSEEFYSTLKKHALPVNMHAVRAFSASPRKLDMLFWLGYRLNSLEHAIPISWEALQGQFGTGYRNARAFRFDFAKEIEEIKYVFPKLPVKVTEEGITISPGSPEVLAMPKHSRAA